MQSVSAARFSESGSHSRRAEINALVAQLPIRCSAMALCAFRMFLGRLDRQRKVFRDYWLRADKNSLRGFKPLDVRAGLRGAGYCTAHG